MTRYEPLCKIASGENAAVYAGIANGAVGISQIVAIKRLHGPLVNDPGFRDAFVQEAKTANRVHHANIVLVQDVVDGEQLDVVMDYVEGASLSDLMRAWQEDPPSRPEGIAIRVVLDACAGLQAAHDLGIVHRDISPANILVGLDGIGRVTDFGLAKPASLRGRLGYVAPECVEGLPIDPRVDVFAMGVVLWEAIARKRLFRGEDDVDTLYRVQHVEAPTLVGPIDAVARKALAKSPDERYPTLAAMADALESAARAQELFATHGDVARSFSKRLRETLAEQRREIEEALAARPAPAAPAPVSVPEASPAPRKRRGLFVISVVVPIVAAATVAALISAYERPHPTKPASSETAKKPPRN